VERGIAFSDGLRFGYKHGRKVPLLIHSGEDLEQTVLRYVHLYNSQLPQSALKGRAPIAALKDWQNQGPELFRKRVYKYAGCET
jgi:hypothetical protein